ncbi:MAG: tetratricopeptide repeat protein, partial [Proteobacteria bacterium]|nr:tetratricopeptide repeat protein [Pseudomonadota bacterium]
SSVEATTFLGRAHDFQQAFTQAEEVLRRARDLDKSDPDPAIHLGRVLLRAGRPDEARVIFAEILDRLAPGNVLAEMGLRRAEHLIRHGPATVRASNAPVPATVICVKQGTLYGADYVNRLASMVRRNAESDVRFVCFTEDPSDLDTTVEVRPLPAPGLQGWWNKVALFREDLDDIGDRLLFLDLDVVITGSIDPLLRYESDFAVMDNDYVPGCNTSVVLFRRGSRPDIWHKFTPEVSENYGGDQDWVAINVPDADLWPVGWCVTYRLRAAKAPPPDSKIICFSGRPNPEDYPADWIRDYWY